ncbi:MAG: sugar phosphate nucleotidyltransferase [bacterium]
MSKRAIILAGGLGKRLQPYTLVLPKPLMPIGEYPILEVVIRQLAYNGFDHLTMCVNHQAELFMAFFGNGDKWGIKIDYSIEDKPLGTIAPLKLINSLPENFLIMNGDILTDIDFNDLYQTHINNKNIFTIASAERVEQIEYGVLDSNENSKLIGFSEKPKLNYLVSMGIYVANRDILGLIPLKQKYGFDDLMNTLLKEANNPSIYKYDGNWLDIGRPDDYVKAIDEFENNKTKFLKD